MLREIESPVNHRSRQSDHQYHSGLGDQTDSNNDSSEDSQVKYHNLVNIA